MKSVCKWIDAFLDKKNAAEKDKDKLKAVNPGALLKWCGTWKLWQTKISSLLSAASNLTTSKTSSLTSTSCTNYPKTPELKGVVLCVRSSSHLPETFFFFFNVSEPFAEVRSCETRNSKVKSCYYFAEAVAKILARLMNWLMTWSNSFLSVIQVHCLSLAEEFHLGISLISLVKSSLNMWLSHFKSIITEKGAGELN